MVAMQSPLLPFDAHNHVHMGPTILATELLTQLRSSLSGMAVMSTHPRDFDAVLHLSTRARDPAFPIIACIGVHPWFLHELTDDDWSPHEQPQLSSNTADNDISSSLPKWIQEMEDLLVEHPHLPVGEVGLDNFHFDPITKALSCPMDRQVLALELQLDLATRQQRPVSVHCVRAMGKLMSTLETVQEKNNGLLPPMIYFHAFGGKMGTATQLFKWLERNPKKNHLNRNQKGDHGTQKSSNQQQPTRVYFGFAPIVNFESPKTMDVIREVGIDRLVLETDHEDGNRVASSMELGVDNIARTLGVSEEELIAKTCRNAHHLYGIDQRPG